MVINKKNGKMYAEANRVEKLRFLSAMRTELRSATPIGVPNQLRSMTSAGESGIKGEAYGTPPSRQLW